MLQPLKWRKQVAFPPVYNFPFTLIWRSNQYYCKRSLYINYIYSIICLRTSLKKPLGYVGNRTCVAGLSQQTCNALDHYASPKKDASNPKLSNTVISFRPNVMKIFTLHIIMKIFILHIIMKIFTFILKWRYLPFIS